MFIIFAYNSNQMFLPHHNKIFGSHYIKIDSPSKFEDVKTSLVGKNYYQEFEISRTHWLKLDHSDLRCNPRGREVNTTKCITEYLEANIGCSMGLQGGNPGVKRLMFNHIIITVSQSNYFGQCHYQIGATHQMNLKLMPCSTTKSTRAMRQKYLQSQAAYPVVINMLTPSSHSQHLGPL